MKYTCWCFDWDENIDKLLMTGFLYVHGIEYNGELMRYCPWCGTRLTISQDNNQEKLKGGWVLIDRWGWGARDISDGE